MSQRVNYHLKLTISHPKSKINQIEVPNIFNHTQKKSKKKNKKKEKIEKKGKKMQIPTSKNNKKKLNEEMTIPIPHQSISKSIYDPQITEINKERGTRSLLCLLALSTILNQSQILDQLAVAFKKFYSVSPQDHLILYCWNLGLIVGAPLSIVAMVRYSTKRVYYSLASLLGLCHFLNIVNRVSYVVFCVVYGLVGGLAAGSVYLLPIYLIWRYYRPRNKPYVCCIYFGVSYILQQYVLYFLIGRDLQQAQYQNHNE